MKAKPRNAHSHLKGTPQMCFSPLISCRPRDRPGKAVGTGLCCSSTCVTAAGKPALSQQTSADFTQLPFSFSHFLTVTQTLFLNNIIFPFRQVKRLIFLLGPLAGELLSNARQLFPRPKALRTGREREACAGERECVMGTAGIRGWLFKAAMSIL